MSRILITGAYGFTGRYLVERLASAGHEVHGIARHPGETGLAGLAATHVTELSDPRALAQVVADVRPERVVHLAAIAFVAHGDVNELYATNVVGTRNLLQALADAPEAPEAALIASSANVYGNQREGVLTEAVPVAPANDYGITKVASELIARMYDARLPIILVRPFNYTGVGQSPNFIVPKIVAHARERRSEIELGNIDVARDISDVRTVVDCYARLLEEPNAIGQLFNVCSGEAYPLAQIIEMVERIHGHRFNVSVNPAFVRADEVKTLCGSRALLESVIGPVTMFPLEETLRWMLGD